MSHPFWPQQATLREGDNGKLILKCSDKSLHTILVHRRDDLPGERVELAAGEECMVKSGDRITLDGWEDR